MQVTLKCKISLSKKMRNILQNGGSIVLTSDSIHAGKGEGFLVMSDDNSKNIDVNDLMEKETSIMITPIGVSQGGINTSVTNIFSNGEQKNPGVGNVFSQNHQTHQTHQNSHQRTPIDRLAATQPPEDGQNNRAYYSQEELAVPQEFDQTRNAGFIEYVKTYQELMNAVKNSQDKISDINLEGITDRKQKALLQEQKEMQESIGIDAFVVNKNCASLTVNDIGLDLPLNMPKNLGNVSAKKLASSRELWGLFRQKLIELVSPNEADYLIKNAGTMNKTYVPELDIYDSRYEAQDQIESHFYNENGARVEGARSIDLESHLEGDSEALQNLRMAGLSGQSRQASGGNLATLSGNTRTSYHGSSGEQEYLADIYGSSEFSISKEQRQVGRESRRNNSGVKTVASRHSRRR